jgi:hypothetical protein
MKKVVALFSAVMCLVMYSVVSLAETNIWDYEEFKLKYNPNVQMERLDESRKTNFLLNPEISKEIEKLAKEDKSRRNKMTTKEALEFVDELEKMGILENEDKSRYDKKYDEDKKKLRTGNLIESTLDAEEGMSLYEMSKLAVIHAKKAKKEAKEEYPNNYMLEDAFRHFAWNNLSAKDIGVVKTRTGTINHEWGMLMINPMISHFDDKYEEYSSQGLSNAADKALADTINYIPTYKYYAIKVCKKSYGYFKSEFDDSNIMDLHNNCFGRAYSQNYSNLSYREAFRKAKSKNELILDEDDVTNGNYDYVWQSEWYTY